MNHTTHPAKDLVREYMARRARELKPPPTPEEIRRQLGWNMLELDVKHAYQRN